jgi:lipopolysaccharide export system protein LptC
LGWSDQSYSRLVRLGRVALPLGALALLSSLFLLWETRDPGRLPYTEVDIEALLRLPSLTRPTFTGVMSDGATIRLTAEAASPGTDGGAAGANATAPRLQIVSASGETTTAEAAEARIDETGKTLLLSGGFRVQTDMGYAVQGDQLVAALDQTRLESLRPITAQGPQGEIDAGRFVMDRSEATDAALLHFHGGVKLIYRPETTTP